MKLRCTTNSIRIRLRKSEVEQFEQEGNITDHVAFTPSQALQFSLQLEDGAERVLAKMQGSHIRVFIPKETGIAWMQTNQVGISAQQPIGDGEILDILIEKDFPCTTRPDEDKSDFFSELQSKDENVC